MKKKQKLNHVRKAFQAYEFKCKDGCFECCDTKVPISSFEKKRMKKVNDDPDGCPYLGDGGCSCYDERPIVCRAHGSVDLPPLDCHLGYAPKKKMPAKEAIKIMAYYDKEIRTAEDRKEAEDIWEEQQKVAWSRFIERLKEIPEKAMADIFSRYQELTQQYKRIREGG